MKAKFGMRITFNIVSSVPSTEPSQDYFSALAATASHALGTTSLDHARAWALCEYLDAVDGGDLAMDRGLYRQCVSALGAFLADHRDDAAARKLANKSWAANTLLEMVEDYAPVQPLRRAA